MPSIPPSRLSYAQQCAPSPIGRQPQHLNSVRKTPLETIQGLVPSLKELKDGCRFGPRSGFEHSEESLNQRPEVREIAPDHLIEWCPDCQIAMGGDHDA